MKPMQFINPQEAELKIAARYRVILILWIAMLASLGILLVLALVLPGSGRANQTLTFSLLGLGLVAVTASVLIKQRLIRQSIEKQQLAPLLNAHVISFALCEAVAMFGLLDHLVTGSPYYHVEFVMAAIGMLLHFPRKDNVRAARYKQF